MRKKVDFIIKINTQLEFEEINNIEAQIREKYIGIMIIHDPENVMDIFSNNESNVFNMSADELKDFLKDNEK